MPILGGWNHQPSPLSVEVSPLHGSDFAAPHSCGQRKANDLRNSLLAGSLSRLHQAIEFAGPQAACAHSRDCCKAKRFDRIIFDRNCPIALCDLEHMLDWIQLSLEGGWRDIGQSAIAVTRKVGRPQLRKRLLADRVDQHPRQHGVFNLCAALLRSNFFPVAFNQVGQPHCLEHAGVGG
ncbi:hypothetical protein ACVILL_007711 [Bradyrhizobium sp. USDA 3364]